MYKCIYMYMHIPHRHLILMPVTKTRKREGVERGRGRREGKREGREREMKIWTLRTLMNTLPLALMKRTVQIIGIRIYTTKFYYISLDSTVAFKGGP